mmetsp:Transcript_26839/g.22115  ORF Transcript_26839/g.22115 Transcript_26839/m.22115 type:complete len:141 (+) Transcript_26839:2-424(+)
MGPMIQQMFLSSQIHWLDNFSLTRLHNKLAINRVVIDRSVPVKTCNACDGQGVVIKVVRMGPMIQRVRQACPQCNGQGQSFKTKKSKEVIEVHIQQMFLSSQIHWLDNFSLTRLHNKLSIIHMVGSSEDMQCLRRSGCRN